MGQIGPPRCRKQRATALPSPVAEAAPWILFHAPWTERAKSGMVLLERMQRFLAAALGPKTPRHAFQRIIPARTPGGRERREPLSTIS